MTEYSKGIGRSRTRDERRNTLKSNICKIEKGTRDLAAILAESERVAAYNGLDGKQTLQLRLLCEELDGMLPNIIGDFDGELWIELEDGVCKIHASVQIPELDTEKKEGLIAIARNRRNAAAVGLVGKIRDAIENLFLDKESMEALSLSTGSLGFGTGASEGVDYSYFWRLDEYRSSVSREEQTEAWDELERSVIASVADNVTVGVRGKNATIVIMKSFA